MGIMFTSEACGGVINVCPTLGNAQREGATDTFNITLFEVFTGENKHCATQVTWCFHLPQVFSFIVPTRLQRATQRVLHRLFHTRNGLFAGLHVALEAAVYGEYTWEVFGYCQELEFNTGFLLLPYLLLAVNTGAFVLCALTNPGTITESNQELYLRVYAHDGVMFRKGVMCCTCHMEKPARSKHCSVCNCCVHRFDHHCVWVNNCIGAFNMRYFLIYLFTLTAMAADIAIITVAFLIQVVLLSNLMYGSYVDEQGQEHEVEIPFLIQHLFLIFPRIVFMLGFVIVLSLVLGAYCCFTLYLALTNQTSNEWYKWRRYECPHCRAQQPHDKHTAYRNAYSRGVWINIKEIIKPPTVSERKKKT
ncbi:probable palmitoyltransferase ZDHHC4 isoform X1 [Alligator sinensis]|uniref:Palmitoyltransferase n=1 Tax=Alligator sinensis TaxID=38654 RepID=A0A3Q0H107_ALLSI|nr:probable palmitoyltransferase ZDHHC4 isoform X1 [Alligator sinensis]